MNTHIDQLAQWYADAERITDTNLPRIGDTLIFPYNADGYAIEVEDDDWTPNIVMPGEVARILHRAPKPKPAWHDAPAIVATCTDSDGDEFTGVWVPEYGGDWLSNEGHIVSGDDLRDVTPLVEAKVTDEMVEAAQQEAKRHTGLILERLLVSCILAAALGIETE